MDLASLNANLGNLLQSINGCPYSDLSEGTLECKALAGRCVLNVLHLNVRSLHKNAVNLTFLLSELKDQGITIHVIGLCETYLSDTSSATLGIENYQVVHQCRNNTAGEVRLF